MSTQKMVEEIIHVGAVEFRYTTQELDDLRRLIIEIPVFGEPMHPEIKQGDSGSVCVSCMGIESTAYFLQTDELVVVEMCPAMNRFAADVTRKYPIKILSTELDEGLAKSSVFDYNGGEILFNKAISNRIISETIHCPIIPESILAVVYHSMVIDVIKVDKRFDMLRGDITDIENMWTAAAEDQQQERRKLDKDNTPVVDDAPEDFPIIECEIDNEVSEFWESIHNEVFRKARRWYVTNRIASMIMDVPDEPIDDTWATQLTDAAVDQAVCAARDNYDLSTPVDLDNLRIFLLTNAERFLRKKFHRDYRKENRSRIFEENQQFADPKSHDNREKDSACRLRVARLPFA